MALNKKKAAAVLNSIVEHELAGMVRYTQYSLMIFGHARIPIIGWMQSQVSESMVHATQAGEEVTSLGEKVSLGIGKVVGTHHNSMDEILEELITHEQSGIRLYEDLLKVAEGKSLPLEEFARQMIRAEDLHVNEIRKMLGSRSPS